MFNYSELFYQLQLFNITSERVLLKIEKEFLQIVLICFKVMRSVVIFLITYLTWNYKTRTGASNNFGANLKRIIMAKLPDIVRSQVVNELLTYTLYKKVRKKSNFLVLY